MTAVVASGWRAAATGLHRATTPLAMAVTAVTVGAVAVAIGTAPGAAGLSLAGASWAGAMLELAAGWSLAGIGLENLRRGRRPFGLALWLAGIAWFLPYFALPHVGSSVAFTIGLVLGPSHSLFVAIALLAASPRVANRRTDLVLVIVGSALLGLLAGLIPAMTFSPEATHCAFCPSNLVGVVAAADTGEAVARFGYLLASGWAACLVIVTADRLRQQGAAARRIQGAFLVAGAVYLAIAATAWLRLSLVAAPATDGFAHALRVGQAIALIAVAGGVTLEWLQVRRARVRVARMVADLGQSPPPGGLRDALAELLRDPELRVGYPIGAERFVDVNGRDLALDPRPDRRLTPLVRDGATVAILDHRHDVLDHPGELEEVVRAARLGLEHERLQAEARVRLDEVVAARRRIVRAAEATRRQLERDLHDGAQQRLIALAMGMRLLSPPPEARPSAVHRLLREAAAEVAAALVELRDVAHGIFPSVLGDEGLRAAIEGLAEGSAVPIRIDMVDERLETDVETTAYYVVQETLRAATGPLSVAGHRRDGHYALAVEAAGAIADIPVEALCDRVAALGGSIIADRSADGQVSVHVELPCGS